ncbi:MAG: hypothetical protein CM15mP23_01930 [Cryomorphaceae bacterium]|nr:MAG: hypothetical protein CM15mP23_01930 [Cryomorphaceae bacterium]
MAYNINRKVSDILLFEFGNTYNKYGDEFVEAHRLAFWMTGVKQEENWNVTSSKVDFFFMKGMVEKVLQNLAYTKVLFQVQ